MWNHKPTNRGYCVVMSLCSGHTDGMCNYSLKNVGNLWITQLFMHYSMAYKITLLLYTYTLYLRDCSLYCLTCVWFAFLYRNLKFAFFDFRDYMTFNLSLEGVRIMRPSLCCTHNKRKRGRGSLHALSSSLFSRISSVFLHLHLKWFVVLL